jgi:hypothetical protein
LVALKQLDEQQCKAEKFWWNANEKRRRSAVFH